MNKELPKITSDRIENVFDVFVVNKLLGVLTQIKREVESSDVQYEGETLRACVDYIKVPINEIKNNARKLKMSLSENGDVYGMIVSIRQNADELIDCCSHTEDLVGKIQKKIEKNDKDTEAAIEILNSILTAIKEDVLMLLSEIENQINENNGEILQSIKESNETIVSKTAEHGEKFCNSLNQMKEQSEKSFENVSNSLKLVIDNIQKQLETYHTQGDKLENDINKSNNLIIDKIEAGLKICEEKHEKVFEEKEKHVEDLLAKLNGSINEYIDRSNDQACTLIRELAEINNQALILKKKQIIEEYSKRFEELEAENQIIVSQNKLIQKLQYAVLAVSGSALVGILANIFLTLF